MAIFGGAVAVLALAYGGLIAGVGPMIELPLDIVTALVTVVGVYFIYKTAGTYGGDVGRYLAVIGIGLGYYALTFIPHVQLHIAQMEMGVSSLGPVNVMSLYMFQHVATIWVFLMVSYGFYLFWQGGSQ
jgi:hypothetical protein